MRCAFGAASFLVLEAVGATMLVDAGFVNAFWAILATGLIIFLAGIPISQYAARYGLTAQRVGLAKPGALVMHPGPMNEGVEIAADVAAGPQSVITDQVTNGVAIRMALLYLLAGVSQRAATRLKLGDMPMFCGFRWYVMRLSRRA